MPSCRALLAAVALVAAALSGCGAEPAGEPGREASLLLDFQPNAVHAGIYAASARGFDRDEGERLRVRVPSASSDAVKLLAAGRTDFAVLDIHDLAIARERGADVVGVMALVQRPLAAVLAQPAVRSPSELEGRRVGVTGLPSDDAVLESIVRGDGGDPDAVRRTTIGFTAVPALLAGRVGGATAFWNVEGVALKRRRPEGGEYNEFRVDDYGAPSYPELVVTVTRSTLDRDPDLVRSTVAALARGYESVLAAPATGIDALLRAQPSLDRAEIAAQMAAVLPAFRAPGGKVGELDAGRLQDWAQWEARFGITKHPPDVRRAFDGRYVP